MGAQSAEEEEGGVRGGEGPLLSLCHPQPPSPSSSLPLPPTSRTATAHLGRHRRSGQRFPEPTASLSAPAAAAAPSLLWCPTCSFTATWVGARRWVWPARRRRGGERVSVRGGRECLCESPVPGVRATQSRRRGARAGDEPETSRRASESGRPQAPAPPRTHSRPCRAPLARAFRGLARARRPSADPEEVRGSPGDVTAAPRGP